VRQMSVTRTTYKVLDFLDWQRNGTLDLRPVFQRGSVWKPKAKSFFIDTLVKGFPVPIIFLQDETNPKTYAPRRLVVDGQQRIRTVLAFIDRSCLPDSDSHDEFVVLPIHNPEIAGRPFAKLPKEIRHQILNFEFSVHVLPATTSNQALLETFARMNATGVKANEQELRNAKFFGAFKTVAYELSYEQLERWLHWRVFSRDQIARMKDVELTSELVQFMLRGVSGKDQRALDGLYDEFDEEFDQSGEVARRLRFVLDKLEDVYRAELNQLFEEEFSDTPFKTHGWFYVLFAFVYDLMFAASALDKSPRPRTLNSRRVREFLMLKTEALASKNLPPDVLKSLRGASTDKVSRETRYSFLSQGYGN
jgi:hypothetical protein